MFKERHQSGKAIIVYHMYVTKPRLTGTSAPQRTHLTLTVLSDTLSLSCTDLKDKTKGKLNIGEWLHVLPPLMHRSFRRKAELGVVGFVSCPEAEHLHSAEEDRGTDNPPQHSLVSVPWMLQ